MDETLVDAAPGPSPSSADAFSALYTRHYGHVLAYARRRTDETAARDVTAETFLVAWRRLDVALERGLPWLYATAALTLRNHHRSEHRTGAVAERLASLAPAPADDHAEGHASRDAVRRAVRSLPEGDRELLLLTVWEQLDVRSAALVVECSTGAAHVRLHRARRRLRALLEDPGPLEPGRGDRTRAVREI